MGDAVNQAARFEPANKEYGTLIIVGETTAEEAKDSIEVRLLDKMIAKGKTKPISIYELIARKGQMSGQKGKVVALYEQALRLHWERKWDEAAGILGRALELDPGDVPSVTLLERINKYKETPPPDSWNGEFVQTRK
jgi:adenylate cyclase